MARRGRIDLTKWLCHFVHTTAELQTIYEDLYPDEVDDDQESEFAWKAPFEFVVDWDLLLPNDEHESYEDEEPDSTDIRHLFPEFQHYEQYNPLKKGASALEVLLRIIDTGHLRASWSFRKGRPTVYGNRAACCFTEMPLYALLSYAKARNHKLASNYGIAVKRDELFRAGARPVIYGLTGDHKEEGDWPRYLKTEEIGLTELYRYVALNITNFKIQSDWMHEREWRWPFTVQKADCPGLSLWLNPPSFNFSQICLFVPTRAEADHVLNCLKQRFDALFGEDGCHDRGGWEFKAEMFKKTFVFSIEEAIEECKNKQINPEVMRIEDIPKRSLQTFQSPPASEQLIIRVRKALKRATKASIKGARAFRETNPEYEHMDGTCGYAHVSCTSAQSPVVSALKILYENEEISLTPLAEEGYRLNVIAFSARHWQSVFEAEAAGEAAAKILNELLPEATFDVFSRLD